MREVARRGLPVLRPLRPLPGPGGAGAPSRATAPNAGAPETEEAPEGVAIPKAEEGPKASSSGHMVGRPFWPRKGTELSGNTAYRIAAFAAVSLGLFTLACLILYVVLHFGSVDDVVYDRRVYDIDYVCYVLGLVALAVCLFDGIIDFAEDRKEGEDIYASGLPASMTCLAVFMLVFLACAELAALGGGVSHPDGEGLSHVEWAAAAIVNAFAFEAVFHCAVIGIPMAVAFKVRGKAPSFPLTGGFGVGRLAWVLILISTAALCALYVYRAGAIGVPLGLARGIIFGYVFAEYGFRPSIMMSGVFGGFKAIGFMGMGGLEFPVEAAFAVVGIVVLALWMGHGDRSVADPRGMPWIAPGPRE